ncbi:MAG TPA: hypothetical protein PL110_09735 [Candidatus Eremiobacteraeota bacterium]|nr:MAG: hypothetical protein BWY64_03804 [bacterium ADurb.Bin363]HPZ08383.1 hypothetical protein [Candidatus Eremiobacteraeota bacterium]
MAEYQHQIRLGYSAKDGKWVLMDERNWVEVDNLDDMGNYLRNIVKVRMEGEIILRRKDNKWYMRDASKYQLFGTPEEMMTAFKELENNYEDEIIQSSESIFGVRRGKARSIDMERFQTWAKDVSSRTETEVKETRQFCAWHKDVEKVATCTGCDKSLCEKCIGKQIEENHFCHSCWTQYKYSSHLEKFKKMREKEKK